MSSAVLAIALLSLTLTVHGQSDRSWGPNSVVGKPPSWKDASTADFQEINSARKAEGSTPLVGISPALTAAAEDYMRDLWKNWACTYTKSPSKDVCEGVLYQGKGADGSTVFERVVRATGKGGESFCANSLKQLVSTGPADLNLGKDIFYWRESDKYKGDLRSPSSTHMGLATLSNDKMAFRVLVLGKAC